MPRILSVDPNLLNRRVVEAFLHGQSDLLDFAADGEEAITAVSTGAFDVVLMELRLPGLSGFETTRRIRNLAAPLNLVTIIAVTTYSFRGARAECLAAGMDDHLPIPLSRDALLNALDQVDRADRRNYAI